MAQPKFFEGDCWEGADKVLMNYVVGAAATAITQATITAITYIVKQYSRKEDAESDTNGTVITAEATAGAVSGIVFDTLQTNNDWDADTTGFNVKFTVPAASLPTGGKWYRASLWFDPTSGADFPVEWILYCRPTTKD